MLSAAIQVLGALALAFFALCAYVSAQAWYYQCRLGPGLRSELGFEQDTQIRPAPRRLTGYDSVVAISAVSPGGAFDRAGLRAGDILPHVSYTDLYRRLHRSRGGVARLRVATGGLGPPFEERPTRELEITVPPRRGRSSDSGGS